MGYNNAVEVMKDVLWADDHCTDKDNKFGKYCSQGNMDWFHDYIQGHDIIQELEDLNCPESALNLVEWLIKIDKEFSGELLAECDECLGHGEDSTHWYDENGYHSKWGVCPNCGGEGWVGVEEWGSADLTWKEGVGDIFKSEEGTFNDIREWLKGIDNNPKSASRKVFSMRQHYGHRLKASHRHIAHKKTAGTVQIDVEDYIDWLDDRFIFWEAKSNATQSRNTDLREELYQFIRDNSDGMLLKRPSYVVDNFIINGEFIYREWFSKDGEYSELYEKYNGSWEDLCENEGIIYNDEVCCINLGF